MHPGVAQVGRCEVCGRPMCVNCAIPVRGALVGTECVPLVLDDRLEPLRPPPARPRGDVPALFGFGLVVAVSVLPWSRFGDASGFMQAWSLHWSLLSVAAAALGLGSTLMFRVRPRDPRVEVAVIAGLAALTVLGAVLHAMHPPPPVSRVPAYAWLAAVSGAALAMLGAGRKLAALSKRPTVTRSARV